MKVLIVTRLVAQQDVAGYDVVLYRKVKPTLTGVLVASIKLWPKLRERLTDYTVATSGSGGVQVWSTPECSGTQPSMPGALVVARSTT